MPTVTEEVVEGLAFCPDPRCPGYEQQGVAVRVRHHQWSYLELGGDMPGIERSTYEESFAEHDTPPDCPHCGRRMEATTQVRPDYARISGQDPLRLLNLEQHTQVRELAGKNSEQALELEKLRTTMAEMRAEMMEMMLAQRNAMAPTTAVGSEGGELPRAGEAHSEGQRRDVIVAVVILGVVLVAQLGLIAFLLSVDDKQEAKLIELIAMADRMAQRLQAPQAAIAAAANEMTDPATYAPPALVPDDDDAFWESREELAARLAREEVEAKDRGVLAPDLGGLLAHQGLGGAAES